MSVQNQVTDDAKKPQNPQQLSDEPQSTTVGSKEAESAHLEEEKLLKEVVETSRQADLEAEKKVTEAIGNEARLAKPEIKVPPDIAEHGVKSPQAEASEIAQKGSTIELPISEDQYMVGEKMQASGRNVKGTIVGVSSLIALATFVGRIVKLAHKHAKRIIFRKGES